MSFAMFLLSLVACAVLPLLSLAFPSSHPRSLHRRAFPRPRVMTYYADWAPPSSMDYSLFDAIIFAFALPDNDFQLRWDTDQAPTLLENLVPPAHAHSVRVLLSIGGWTGSRYFSDAVSTPQNRDIFVSNILQVYNHYNLDGIDIDWEYPGQMGQQGNRETASDSANMLQFFKALREKLPQGALISAAVLDSTFAGSDGLPMKDVSTFSQLLDWITLMNYDVYDTRQPPGPNAPLSDGCGNSSQPTQNAAAAYNAWTTAGFPPDKMVLGVPAYGYIVQSSDARLSSRSAFRAHSEDDSGQIQFRSLVDQGILVQNSGGSFDGSGGFTRGWDNCSATPYLHSDAVGQVIPYDDPESLGIKAAWTRDMSMLGVNLFDIHGDTPQYHLTHALRANLLPSIARPLSSAVATSSPTALFPSTWSLNPGSSSPSLSATPPGVLFSRAG